MSELKTTFEIYGSNAPAVNFQIPPGQHVMVQSRAFIAAHEGIDGKKHEPKDAKEKPGIKSVLKRARGGETMLWDYKNNNDNVSELEVGPNSPGQITPIDMRLFPDGLYTRDGAFFAAANGDVDVSNIRTSQIKTKNKGKKRLAVLMSQGFSMQSIKPETEDDKAATVFLESAGALKVRTLKDGEKLRVNKNSLHSFSVGAEFNRDAAKKGGRLSHILFGEGFSNFVFEGPCTVIYQSRATIGEQQRSSGTAVGGAVGGAVAGAAVAAKTVTLG